MFATPIRVNLRKPDMRILERSTWGLWSVDGTYVSSDKAIELMVEAINDLGYFAQVAKDVLPEAEYEMVREAYVYRDPDIDYGGD